MKRIVTLSLVLIITGCASLVLGLSNKQRIYAVQSDFVAAQGLALKYESRPRCAPLATWEDQLTKCSNVQAVVEIRKANAAGQTAILDAQKLPENTDLNTLQGKLNLAVAATKTLRDILAIYGVK